jgi:hypothetical protein
MNRNQIVLTLGAVLVAGLALATPRSEASERVFVGASFGTPAYYAPAPVVVEHRYIPGHYVSHVDNVLVEPERHVREWVPEVRETRVDRYGRGYSVIVNVGYYRDVCIPAHYERRESRVWVDGCYEGSNVAVAYPVAPRPRISVGGFFRF